MNTKKRVVPHAVQHQHDIHNFTEESSINIFLQKKSLELAKVKNNTALEFGKIFHEVHFKLSSHHQGTYYNWLDKNSISRNTAFRHRRRYEFFKKSKSPSGQEFISDLPYCILDDIYKFLDRDNLIEHIDEGMTREELESLIEISKNKEKNEINFFSDIKIKYIQLKVIFQKICPEKIPKENIHSFEKDMDQISQLISKWA